MIYEILDNSGSIINTIIADESFVEKHYPGHYRLVGPEPQTYIAPVITKASFRFRLTDAEYVGILSSAKTDIEVAAWVETFNMVSSIDLDNQRTKDGVANLVSRNRWSQVRADQILTNPVQPQGRP